MTIADRFNSYSESLKKKFEDEGFRVELDDRAESIGRKVREAQLLKIPLMITIGEQEETQKTVAVRTLLGKVHFGMKVDEFIERVKENIKEKRQDVGF